MAKRVIKKPAGKKAAKKPAAGRKAAAKTIAGGKKAARRPIKKAATKKAAPKKSPAPLREASRKPTATRLAARPARKAAVQKRRAAAKKAVAARPRREQARKRAAKQAPAAVEQAVQILSAGQGTPVVPPPPPAVAKTRRVLAALNQQEADRVPVGEFFWTNFVRRCQQQYGPGFNPYKHWDLDLIVVNPNMDPHITGLQVLEKTDDRIVLRTGFGATIESRSDCPMPSFVKFDTETYEQMEALQFDDPADERRYSHAIADQINGVGDAINLNLPSYVDRVNSLADDFCVFGSVAEPHEMIWRIMGTDNVLLKLAEEPRRMAKFIERLGDFMVGIVHAQAKAAAGKLSGMYIWGDVAYDHGMFFSPVYWREVYKPQVKRICDAIHQYGLKTIYHGCGNARVIYDDYIEAGVDCYNPLEAKAGLDVVELKRAYKGRWAFNGNIDVRVLATNDREKVRREVLRKLNAAKGGGYILQSDHSVPHNVDPDTYDYVVQLAREYGQYPLGLGEWDEEV